MRERENRADSAIQARGERLQIGSRHCAGRHIDLHAACGCARAAVARERRNQRGVASAHVGLAAGRLSRRSELE
jgi:hypothetical protein